MPWDPNHSQNPDCKFLAVGPRTQGRTGCLNPSNLRFASLTVLEQQLGFTPPPASWASGSLPSKWDRGSPTPKDAVGQLTHAAGCGPKTSRSRADMRARELAAQASDRGRLPVDKDGVRIPAGRGVDFSKGGRLTSLAAVVPRRQEHKDAFCPQDSFLGRGPTAWTACARSRKSRGV